MQKPIISVIIPCYNVASYISRCIESLLACKFNNVEIILINDGSKDHTLDICLNYREKYPTIIQVYSQKNLGVSAARNKGLDIAIGRYIMFVDPDDYVEPNFLSKPCDVMESKGFDMLVFGFDNGENQITLPRSNYEYYSSIEIIENLFPKMFGIKISNIIEWYEGKGIARDKETAQIWRWIYRTDFIRKHNIRFSDVKVGEDTIWNSECLLYAKSLGSINDVLYHYIPLENGLMKSNQKGKDMKQSLKNKLDALQERVHIGKLYTKITGKEALPLYAGSCVMSCFELAALLSRENGNYNYFYTYVSQKTVLKSISIVPLGGNIKQRIPMLLLKYKLFKTLYFIFRIINRLKIKITY